MVSEKYCVLLLTNRYKPTNDPFLHAGERRSVMNFLVILTGRTQCTYQHGSSESSNSTISVHMSYWLLRVFSSTPIIEEMLTWYIHFQKKTLKCRWFLHRSLKQDMFKVVSKVSHFFRPRKKSCKCIFPRWLKKR